MKSVHITPTFVWKLLWIGLVCTAFGISAYAQVQTQTSTTEGQASIEKNVERGEVVDVVGNDLFVKMENGEIRHFPNIPESATATVDGKQVGIHDLLPGMKLQRTITTTTVPKVVTTVQTVTGTVWHVTPPSTVILTLEDNTNQRFTIPKGQKFNVNGEMVDAWGLKKGMKVQATKVIEAPEVEIAEQRRVTGSAPTPPPAPSANVPILIASVATSIPKPAEPAPAGLPRTGSLLPLAGLVGVLSLASSLALRIVRNVA